MQKRELKNSKNIFRIREKWEYKTIKAMKIALASGQVDIECEYWNNQIQDY